MKLDLLKFKKRDKEEEKFIENEVVEPNRAKLGLIELKRYRYIRQNKERKVRNGDVLSKLEAFNSKVKTKKKGGDYHWMKSKLKFHVDSANAYSL